ncbi:MAG: HAD family hydrolase [Aureliella sp.]
MSSLCRNFVFPLWVFCLAPAFSLGADPLPSWNDSAAKQAIVSFVERVTTDGSSAFVPQSERIAVFDNDGCLWCENPMPFQLAYALDALKRKVKSKPALKEDVMVQAALKGDFATLLADGHKGLMRVGALTHSGMTTDQYDASVKEWVVTAKHPRFDRPYVECVYQPMLEVLTYLRANGFKTFIVSGGGQDFMRVWAEEVYGIPPEQVVGTNSRTEFSVVDGKAILTKTLDTVFVDDKAGKPVGIHQFIGRRPIMAFGNSDGDKAMLEYVTVGNPRPSFGLIVHHTDGEREYAYDANPKSSGRLVNALADAPERGWVVVDMAKDWNVVIKPR